MRRHFAEKQKEVLRCANARWNILSGAVRSGKTHASYYLLPLRIAAQGPGNCMLIGKTERTLRRNVIDPLRELYGNSNISNVYGDGLINMFGRKFYVVGANDERAIQKIQGIGLVYAYGDEVATWPESFFRMLQSRLDKPDAKFDGTCNPEGPNHWLKAFIDNAIENAPDTIRHFHFTLDDNPFLARSFVDALKSEYVGVWHQRYIEGLWVLAEGLIYHMFSVEKNVTANIPQIKSWYVGVDYGTSNATVFLLVGIGVDGHIYIVKEYYHAGGSGVTMAKTDAQYAADFVQFLGDVKPNWIFIDPSAKSFRVQLWQMKGKHPALGRVAPADNDVLTGVRRVASLYGSGRLHIHPSCVNTIRENSAYAWDSKAAERGEDKPLKTSDHTKDAERYAIMGIYKSGLIREAA